MLYSGCVRVPAAIPADSGTRASDDSWRSTIALDKRSAKSFIRINDRIRAREIRVIDENGEQLGILPPFEALKIARERGLDLVEVSPTAVPPVCRIQDYGRFLYEKEKSERAARKKQKVITIKEVKFSVTVDEHDYQTKKNQAVRFLAEGDKVKASLRFRGRQMAHRELGYNIINRLIQDIGEAGIVEFMPRMEGTILHAILAPSKKQEAPKPKPAVPQQQAAPRPPAPPGPVNFRLFDSQRGRPLSGGFPALQSLYDQSSRVCWPHASNSLAGNPPRLRRSCAPPAFLRCTSCPWHRSVCNRPALPHQRRPAPHQSHERAATVARRKTGALYHHRLDRRRRQSASLDRSHPGWCGEGSSAHIFAARRQARRT